MYFLGLTNLLFGWAHHIYIVPSAAWIRNVAYLVSMTELIILSKIIWNWRKSLTESVKKFHILPFRFLVASDIWIFINLVLALAISIPAVNIFTHGTHITVAHAMGSTIGINTMVLLASCFYIVQDITKTQFNSLQQKIVKAGFWITNVSLLTFFISLIFAGAEKGQMVIEDKLTFQEIMQHISPYLTVFAFAGIGIFIGLLMVIFPALRAIFRYLRGNA